jgi:hypothetical protein
MTIAPSRPEISALEIRALFEEARRRRRRRRVVAVITVVAAFALVVGLVVVVVSSGSLTGRGTSRSAHRIPVGTFSRPTGVALVFADGLTLDLDHRSAIARTIPGQRPGDQRWPIIRAGNSLVVGWGDVWASPISGGRARLLGPVVEPLPAAEAGAVWLVNYPGGRIGEGTPTISEVTTTGSVLRSELGPRPSSGVPIVGIPGGLAFDTSTGIALWSFDAHAFTRQLGETGPGYIGNIAAGLISWCDKVCLSVHVTTIADGADRTFSLPQPGWVVEPDVVRLSPDGHHVAVMATRGLVGTNPRGDLDVIDTQTGRADVIETNLSAYTQLSWSSNSKELFFVSNDLASNNFASNERRGMTVGQVEARTGSAQTGFIPTQDSEPFVIVNRSQVRSLLGRALDGSTSACPAFGITPEWNQACAYHY